MVKWCSQFWYVIFLAVPGRGYLRGRKKGRDPDKPIDHPIPFLAYRFTGRTPNYSSSFGAKITPTRTVQVKERCCKPHRPRHKVRQCRSFMRAKNGAVIPGLGLFRVLCTGESPVPSAHWGCTQSGAVSLLPLKLGRTGH